MSKILFFILSLLIIYVGGVIFALIYNSRLKQQRFDGIPWKECFDPRKHLSFILGSLIALIPWWVIEQYVMRIYDDECRKCISHGLCVDSDTRKTCGCPAWKKICSPLESCKKKRFGPIIFNKEKALIHLSQTNHKISVKYGQQ